MQPFTALPAADTPPAQEAPSAPTLTLLDRDHSILAFNQRVLDWAQRPEVPLIERLRYLCIVSSNLDEFFEVRAAPHLIAASLGEAKGNETVASFERLADVAHALVDTQYALYNDELMPSFATHGVQIVTVLGRLQVDHEGHRREQQLGVERGHVGAVTLASLEHAHDRERAHALSQRAARDTERDGEVFLDWQAGSSAQFAAGDHRLDALNHDVGL